MRVKLLLYVILFFSVGNLAAQDIHFSNMFTNVLNVNPAFAGYFNGKYRISLAYRDRFRAVAIPYQTVALGFDTKAKLDAYNRKSVGYGVLINYDIAGDARFNTTQISIPISYISAIRTKVWMGSIGILPGIVINSIDYAALRFSDQFDETQTSNSAETQEEFERNNLSRFNIGAGGQITYKPHKSKSFTIGTALYNIAQPNISFFDADDVLLTRRLLLHGMAIIEVRPDIDIVPGSKIQFQAKQQEYHFGAMAIKYFDRIGVSDISGGLWFRSRDKDAVILGIGFTYMDYNFLFNYDFNISDLKTVSNGRGAFEATISKIFYDGKGKKRKPSSVKCPSYL